MKVFNVSIQELEVVDRGRKEFKNISELSDSIKKHGLIHPIVVTPLEEEDKPSREGVKFRLVAGERRFRAMCLLAWKEFPAILLQECSPLQRKEIELEENIQRSNLEWQEEAEMFAQIHELKQKIYGPALGKSDETDDSEKPEGWGVKDTAELTNTSSGAVSKKIKLAKKLRERPELKKRVKNLPASAAMREIERIEKAERLERLHKDSKSSFSTKLLHGSCLDLIKDVKSESIDLVLTDPPYGATYIDKEHKKDTKRKDNSLFGTLTDQDNLTAPKVASLFEALSPELFRVMKTGSHFYIFFALECFHSISSSLQDSGFITSTVPLVWDKGRSTSSFKGYKYQGSHELILFGHKPPNPRRLAKGSRDVLSFKPQSGKVKLHPFEKPLDLLDFLIVQSTFLGQKVLDPFAGSASTLKAAAACGRVGLGFELNESRYKVASTSLISELSKEKSDESE